MHFDLLSVLLCDIPRIRVHCIS